METKINLSILHKDGSKRVINMCRETYEHMKSELGRPKDVKPSHWQQMSADNRVRTHMEAICNYFDGVSYDYKVFE